MSLVNCILTRACLLLRSHQRTHVSHFHTTARHARHHSQPMVPKTQMRIVLAKRPLNHVIPGEHLVTESNAPVSAPEDLQEGQILVRNLWLSLDPAMRGWMNNMKSYIEPVPVGGVMRALGVGEVIASKSSQVSEGQLVHGFLGLQQYAIVPAKDVTRCTVPPGFSPSTALGVFGLTGLTAYFGLLEVGTPKPGETVVVSAAAGATGSVAIQIAKHVVGCRVVGIAGGPSKCAWLKDELGVDTVVDYKSEKFTQELRKAVPQGVDVFFDNVGGNILNETLRYINFRSRVVICGAISSYNSAVRPQGPSNYLALLINRARMEGFVVFDFRDKYDQALADLHRWVAEGKIKHQEDVVDGLEHSPEALLRLFSGANTGKLLVKVADPVVSPPVQQ